MTEDNVMEFCQWLISEKGIEAGNLSDYINNNEEEVLKLAQEFKKPKFKVGGKVEAAAEMFKCGGKAKKKVKKHANSEPITIPVKLDEIRTGTVTYNPDGTRKETIRRTTEQWQGTASPSEDVTHRIVTPGSTAMYVQYGPVDEENRRGYLYNTARNMGAREKANQAKFDDQFNELFRRANFRITTLPNGKMVINDVVHTDNDTLSRTIDQGDTTIVNSAGDRFNNNSIKTRLARKLFGTSAYDQANKNFEMIDFQKTGGIVKAQGGEKVEYYTSKDSPLRGFSKLKRKIYGPNKREDILINTDGRGFDRTLKRAIQDRDTTYLYGDEKPGFRMNYETIDDIEDKRYIDSLINIPMNSHKSVEDMSNYLILKQNQKTVDEEIREFGKALSDVRTDPKAYNAWLKDLVRRFEEFNKGGKIK